MYDLLIFSLKKYQEVIEEKHRTIKNQIYVTEVNFDRQQEYGKKYFEDLEKVNNEFPNIQEIIKKISGYFRDLENLQKKYLGNQKEEIIQKKYETYLTEIDNKGKELGINEQEIPKEITKFEDVVKILENTEKIAKFQESQEGIKTKYGKSIINNYEKYIINKGNLINKYGKDNLQKWMDTYKKYGDKVKDCENRHKQKGFDEKKYNEYIKKISESDIPRHMENIQILFNSISIKDGKVPENFPIRSIKEDYERIQKEQEETDKRRENLKNKSRLLYQICNIGSRGINALVSETRGTGAKLGALISSLWHDDDEMISVWERANNGFWNPNIPISTKQAQSAYENGKIILNWDNGPGIVSEGIVSMLTLVVGGGAITKGITKGATKIGVSIGTKLASGIGLFSSGFIQQAGPSFQEGFNAGMTGNQAMLYAITSATLQGSLELISPNEFINGLGKNLAKTYIKEILKSESKQSLKAIGKLFLKNVGSEIGEEIFQEEVQLAAGNLVNMWANNQYDLGKNGLDADRNPKNFAATALVTALTTGFVAGGGFAMQTPGMLNNQSRAQLIEEINKNAELRSDVMNIIDKAIAGKVKIPNVDVQALQNLKGKLNGNTDSYFNNKSHKILEGDGIQNQAIENSKYMDNILQGLNEQTKSAKLSELGNRITQQYKQATQEELKLSDEQLLSILDAHEQDGKLGELSIGQLRVKVKILSEAITNPKVKRFLLEAGFCGSRFGRIFKKQTDNGAIVKNIEKGKNNQYDILNLILELGYTEQNGEYIPPKEFKTSRYSQSLSKEDAKQIQKRLQKPLTQEDKEYMQKIIDFGEGKYIDYWKNNPEELILFVGNLRKNSDTGMGDILSKTEIMENIILSIQNKPFGATLKAFETYQNEYAINGFLRDMENGNITPENIYNHPRRGKNANRYQKIIKKMESHLEKTKTVSPMTLYRGDSPHIFESAVLPNGTKINLFKEIDAILNSYDNEKANQLLNSGLSYDEIQKLAHTALRDNSNWKQELTELIKKILKQNITIEMPGFMSASASEQKGINFTKGSENCPQEFSGIIWNLDVPQGSKATCIDVIDPYAQQPEYEFLFQKGSKLKIKDMKLEEINGKYYIKIDAKVTQDTTEILNYFNGKSHQFDVTEAQARSNSENMDKILNEMNEQNKSAKLEELRKIIIDQYKQATGKELQLTDEQLLSILDAHEQDGILGELTMGQLRKKVKVLNETITDPKVRRFLFEAGFCGSLFNRLFNNKSQDLQPQGNNIERKRIESSKMSDQEKSRFNRNLDKRLTNLQPTNKINIGNGTIIYSTNRIVGKNSGREYIIGYSFDSYGTMHLRQFYRSMSEGCWRACPGMREDGNLSKGEFITDSSYETTTKVDINLGNTFDNLSNNYYNNFKNYGINNKYFEYSPISYIANEYHKDNILQEDMGPQNIYIRKLFPNLVGNDNTGHNRYGAIDYYNGKYGNTVENVIKGYNKLVPEGLDYKHMKINPSKSYSYHHDYLGNVNVQVCTTKRNGIDLDFHFARAINSPDKVWIENVVCSDAQLNSRGVYNKQINAGPLVAKPIDYDSQCPNGPEKNQVLPIITGNYRDIRNLYQGNPIIKKFKQISK